MTAAHFGLAVIVMKASIRPYFATNAIAPKKCWWRCLGPPAKEDGKYTGLPILGTGTAYAKVGGVNRSGVRRDDEDALGVRRCGAAGAPLVAVVGGTVAVVATLGGVRDVLSAFLA